MMFTEVMLIISVFAPFVTLTILIVALFFVKIEK